MDGIAGSNHLTESNDSSSPSRLVVLEPILTNKIATTILRPVASILDTTVPVNHQLHYTTTNIINNQENDRRQSQNIFVLSKNIYISMKNNINAFYDDIL